LTRPMPKPDVVRLAYSVGETAQALSISAVTLHRAISHGLIRNTKLGRVIRIPTAEVERLAAEGLGPIPRLYQRKTSGPTTKGRPRKAVPAKAKAQQGTKPSRRRKAAEGERSVAS
jgi:excisionase family DNA binding protein